jgi:hypothetical protein
LEDIDPAVDDVLANECSQVDRQTLCSPPGHLVDLGQEISAKFMFGEIQAT